MKRNFWSVKPLGDQAKVLLVIVSREAYLSMKNCRRPGAVDPTARTAMEMPPVRYGTKNPCHSSLLWINLFNSILQFINTGS